MVMKIKINNDSDLIKVQEKVFENGGSWFDRTKDVLTSEQLLEEVDGIEGLCVELDYLDYGENAEKEICLTLFENVYEFETAKGKECSVNDFLAIENLREVLETE